MGPGVLSGWLFADLALMLAFVFLDSSVSGTAVSPGETTASTTSTTTTISVTSTSLGPLGVDPKPIEVLISTDLIKDPSSFINELERQIARSDSVKRSATRFLVVMVRVGSMHAKSRTFAGPLAEKVKNLVQDHWQKAQLDLTYYDVGDDTKVEFGLVKLKLFPVSG
jgi:hypothetical protein